MATKPSESTQYVALLRGINVGGNRSVSMDKLRTCITDAGFSNVKTLLQSGNLIFSGAPAQTALLEAALEKVLIRNLGVPADFMIRTAEEWEKIIAGNPFPKMASDDPSHLVVICLKEAPAAKAVETLQAAIKGREKVEAIGRELYVTYVDGIGTSKLTNVVIEKFVGARGTGRNWNTALKIQKALGE